MEVEAPPQALSREGGMGGTLEGLIQQPANPLAANPVATKAVLVALLREHGAFAKIAAGIAETFIAVGITELAEAHGDRRGSAASGNAAATRRQRGGDAAATPAAPPAAKLASGPRSHAILGVW